MGNSCGDLRKRHLSSGNNPMLYQQVHCVLIKIQVSGRKGKGVSLKSKLWESHPLKISRTLGSRSITASLTLPPGLHTITAWCPTLTISPAKSRLQHQPQRDCQALQAVCVARANLILEFNKFSATCLCIPNLLHYKSLFTHLLHCITL